MIPQTQLVTADPARGDGHNAQGEAGDCFRTCLASILDLEPHEVPNFAAEGGNHAWWHAARRWIRRDSGRDLIPVDVEWPVNWAQPENVAPWQRHAIATGPSPRGNWMHSVVVDAFTGELAHDPHPSRDGLAGDVVDVIVVVLPYDPAPE